MIRLLFIVPYPELRSKVEYVLSHHKNAKRVNADICTMTVEDTPDVPTGEYDAIIARGYTARKTTSMYHQIPTISLSISGYDIIRAIHECGERFHSKKIAICGFEGQLFEAETAGKIMNIDVRVYAPVEHDEISDTMQKVLEAGCDAVIGGYSVNMLARQMGINSVVIRTGEDTILRALDEAIRTVDQIRQERIVSQMYKTIIYSSKDGILYVDNRGVILVRNRVVRQMHGNISLKDRRLEDTLPYLSKVYRTVMETEKEISGQILTVPGTKTKISVSGTPVIANREISGVVLDLSDITLIQDLEGQIRRKLNERGLKARYTFEDIIHRSERMDRTIATAQKYAASDSNIIIVGETGTGKELFAQSVHNASKRKNGPFVAINCAALAENLLESELFGYVEGAFTGTSKGGKMGLFEQAHGGILFLDEVAEISLATQSKLLRVIQEKQVRRIGDNKVIDVDVRILAATNKSISQLAEQGKFRKDLMYRLDVLRLFIPPLRERGNDIELMFLHFVKMLCTKAGMQVPFIAPDAIPLLYNYPFSGNIRELRNIVERVCVQKDGEWITAQNMREALYPDDLEEARHTPEIEKKEAEIETEEERIRKVLNRCGGNKSKAAALLGINRSTLWRKMQKYQI